MTFFAAAAALTAGGRLAKDLQRDVAAVECQG